MLCGCYILFYFVLLLLFFICFGSCCKEPTCVTDVMSPEAWMLFSLLLELKF